MSNDMTAIEIRRPFLRCEVCVRHTPGAVTQTIRAAKPGGWVGVELGWNGERHAGMLYVHDGVPLDEPVEREIKFVFWDKVVHPPRSGDRFGLCLAAYEIGEATVRSVEA